MRQMLIRSIVYIGHQCMQSDDSESLKAEMYPSRPRQGSRLSGQLSICQRILIVTRTPFFYRASEDHRDEILSLLIPVEAISSLDIFGTIFVPCCGWTTCIWPFLFSVINTHGRYLPVCCKVEHRIMRMKRISRVIVKMDCKCQCHTQGESQ